MNFSLLLLEFLRLNGSLSFTGFGEFYLKNSSAVISKEDQNILPPGNEIAFRTNDSGNSKKFAQFLSVQKNISEIDAEIEIKKQTNFWNSTLEKDHYLQVEHLGTFFLTDSELRFEGARTESLSPDFYGLEEIKLSEINSKNKISSEDNDKKSYSLSKYIFWVFPIVVGLLALTYFGITQPEKTFGRRSFPNDFLKKRVEKIYKNATVQDSLRKDSTKVKTNLDSLRTDSLQNLIIIPTPTKKWSSKKYSNSRWKKAKKHQSR